jgi:hypothetical protein
MYPALIMEKWPFYDDLHSIWKELPNYNTVGVSNSSPGQDHAERAASLFAKRSGETESSCVEDNIFPDYDDSDEDFDVEADISASEGLFDSEPGGFLVDVDMEENESEGGKGRGGKVEKKDEQLKAKTKVSLCFFLWEPDSHVLLA